MKTKHPLAFGIRRSALVRLGAAFVAALAVFTTAARAPAQTASGNALSFDGGNDYVQSQQDVDLANKSFSVEAWAQRRSSNTMDLVVSQGLGSQNRCLMFGFHYYAGNQFVFNFYGDGVESGTADIDSAWHHWAGTYDATTKVRCLYRDGVLVATNVASAHYQGAGPLKVGIGPSGEAPNEFDGLIDDVRVWSVVRSAADIQANMGRPLTGNDPGLLVYWRFDEGAGPIAYDATTNHVDGTLYDGPVWTNSSVLPPSPPTLSPIADQTITQGASTGPILITIGNVEGTGEGLIVTAASDNPVLVPNTASALVLGGQGTQRTLRIVPNPFSSGLATITIQVADGARVATGRFTLTVEPHPELRVTTFRRSSPANAQVEFMDTGTGSTNYALEFRSQLAAGSGWSNLNNVSITTVGNGRLQAETAPPPTPTAFFRVKGFRSAITNVNFSSTASQVTEGAGSVYLTLMFSQPVRGTLHYTVGGPDLDSIETLSGTLTVHGSTATIPIRLRDDVEIGTMKYLVLSLEPGQGYTIGAASQHTLTIEENDLEWQGQLLLPSGISKRLSADIVPQIGQAATNVVLPMNDQTAIGFVLKISQFNGSFQGALKSDGLGFFPAGEMPVQLAFTGDSFRASIQDMVLPADSTFLGTSPHLSLDLAAANTGNATNVTPTAIAGSTTLTISYDGLPHLATTNRGQFRLFKPPTKPAVKEPGLIQAR